MATRNFQEVGKAHALKESAGMLVTGLLTASLLASDGQK